AHSPTPKAKTTSTYSLCNTKCLAVSRPSAFILVNPSPQPGLTFVATPPFRLGASRTSRIVGPTNRPPHQALHKLVVRKLPASSPVPRLLTLSSVSLCALPR